MKKFKYLKMELSNSKRSTIFEKKKTMKEQQQKQEFIDMVHAYEDLDYKDLLELSTLFKRGDPLRNKAISLAMSGRSLETDRLVKGNEFQGDSLESLAMRLNYKSIIDDLGCIRDND